MTSTLRYGANVRGAQVEFRVWAPNAHEVALRLDGRDHPMRRDGEDFTLDLPARAGQRYFYVVDGHGQVPDPVSRLLPEGVHGPTEIVDPESYRWREASWRGIDLRDYVIYELHVGTFSPQGTFDGVIERLDYLRSLGVTAIELMPVNAFPGARNWGYDGVSMYAVQSTYRGPDGLKRLVDAAHQCGLAVLLDVVYNHLGNEGNYLRIFGPYFTAHHNTPWGEAINYDQPGCEGVRRYVLDNALYWLREYRLDGLRLDAIQTIHDASPRHIVRDIADAAHAFAREEGRAICIIGETDENDPRDLAPDGKALDAVWSDDFHHTLHTTLTEERQGYYRDFGRREQMVRALNEGFVFQGEHFAYWGKPRGGRSRDIPLYRHVICAQNHDQVGNRAKGERLTALVPRGARKLAAALLLLAPHTPLLFMGQEYDESAPFQFFTDFGDPALQKAVSEGRRREFEQFDWQEVPDPQDPETFAHSRLTWGFENVQQGSAEMLDWYRSLLELRRALVTPGERTCRAELANRTLVMQVPAREPRVRVVAAFPDSEPIDDGAEEGWRLSLHSDSDGYRVAIFTR